MGASIRRFQPLRQPQSGSRDDPASPEGLEEGVWWGPWPNSTSPPSPCRSTSRSTCLDLGDRRLVRLLICADDGERSMEAGVDVRVGEVAGAREEEAVSVQV